VAKSRPDWPGRARRTPAALADGGAVRIRNRVHVRSALLHTRDLQLLLHVRYIRRVDLYGVDTASPFQDPLNQHNKTQAGPTACCPDSGHSQLAESFMFNCLRSYMVCLWISSLPGTPRSMTIRRIRICGSVSAWDPRSSAQTSPVAPALRRYVGIPNVSIPLFPDIAWKRLAFCESYPVWVEWWIGCRHRDPHRSTAEYCLSFPSCFSNDFRLHAPRRRRYQQPTCGCRRSSCRCAAC
jgi:hypothetical protein